MIEMLMAGGSNTSPVLYVGGYSGEVLAVDTASKNTLWSFDFGTINIYDIKADSEGNVYTLDADSIVRKITPDGTVVWSHRMTTHTVATYGRLAIDEPRNYVYVACRSARVYRLSMSTGSEVYFRVDNYGGENSGIAADGNGDIYHVGNTGGGRMYLYKWSKHSARIWLSRLYFNTGTHDIIVSGDYVYVAPFGGGIQVFNAATGESISTQTTGRFFRFSAYDDRYIAAIDYYSAGHSISKINKSGSFTVTPQYADNIPLWGFAVDGDSGGFFVGRNNQSNESTVHVSPGGAVINEFLSGMLVMSLDIWANK